MLCDALVHQDEVLQDWLDVTTSQDAMRHSAQQVGSVFLAVNADEVRQRPQFTGLGYSQGLLVLQEVQGQEHDLKPFLDGFEGLQAEQPAKAFIGKSGFPL